METEEAEEEVAGEYPGDVTAGDPPLDRLSNEDLKDTQMSENKGNGSIDAGHMLTWS